MQACNRCNSVNEGTGYCPNCGCPESRIMKPLRHFITMVRPECHDKFVKHIQDMCSEQFVADALKLGEWEFQIERHPGHGWWCLYIQAEFLIWNALNVSPMRIWLEERIDKDELREIFSDCYSEVSPPT